jgi:2',3'-cyclic-nucleotide 2'-phosphodiesterase (5'-nucleotidase family)
VRDGAVQGWGYRLIPVFSDVIAPEPEMAAAIAAMRAPYEAMLRERVGETETLLYRRGNFNGTFDDVICDAMLASATPRSRCRRASAGAPRCCRARSPPRTSTTPPR